MESKGYVIVGAGLFGIVMAEQLSKHGYKVIIIDKRNHIGGNCYDAIDCETGILYHVYGPHIFNANDNNVLKYINMFTDFNNYTHQVLSTVNSTVYQMPINLETINSFYRINLKPFEVQDFLKEEISKECIDKPKNLEEKLISLIGRPLYEAFFKEYTFKQWGKEPTELPDSIVSRIPIRNNYYESYYNKVFHGVPAISFAKMFEKMLADENIEIELNCDFFDRKNEFPKDYEIIFTGPIDKFFDYKYGRLEYRSLYFQREIKNVVDFQGTSVMNYPEKKYEYTRICEPRHFYRERWDNYHKTKTIIFKEIPYQDSGENPYYPINDKRNNELAEKYRAKAKKLKNVHFGGRLGEYKYFDMEDTIKSAFSLLKRMAIRQ